MKHLFFIAATTILYYQTAFSQTITAVQNGFWSTGASWDLNRVPTDNDIVIIPLGRTIFLQNTPYEKNNAASRPSLQINIYGTLDFSDAGNDKLYLDNGSKIQIHNGGKIQTSNNSMEIISIYNGSAHNTIWDGSQSPVNGPAYAISTSSGFLNGVLPLKLISFDLIRTESDRIKLLWSTAEEINTSHFEIESFNANNNNWILSGKIDAAGNSSGITLYSFIIQGIHSGINQFRLKQVDIDGKFTYSPVRKLTEKIQSPLKVWYDQHTGRLNVKGINITPATRTVQVYDISGTDRFHRMITSADQSLLLPAMKRGYYVVVLKENSLLLTAKQILINQQDQ